MISALVRTLVLLPLWIALLPNGRVARADASSRPRVAFLGSEVRDVTAPMRQVFDASVSAGITKAAVHVVILGAAEKPAPNSRPCTSETCLRDLVNRSGAQFFVLADLLGSSNQGSASYRVKLRVIRPRPFEVMASSDFACEDCIEDLLVQKTELNTSALMAKLVEVLDAPTVQVEGRTGATNAQSTWRTGPFLLGGVGVAAVATGLLFVAVGNKPTCDGGVSASACGELTPWRRRGIWLSGAGLAAVAGSLIWRYGFDASPSSGTRLSIAPFGVDLTGSF